MYFYKKNNGKGAKRYKVVTGFKVSVCTHCMRLTKYDGRFATANFCRPSQYFVNIHLNSLVIRFFSLPEQKNRRHKSGIGCRKSESVTCKQPNINMKKGKNCCHKLAVGCHKLLTCVHTLSDNDSL